MGTCRARWFRRCTLHMGDRAPEEDQFLPCNIWQGHFPTSNSRSRRIFQTAPARSYDPNGYGLFNMVGNVWEWTLNYIVRSLKKSIRQLHKDRRGFKVCKGGSYLCHASYCHRYRIARAPQILQIAQQSTSVSDWYTTTINKQTLHVSKHPNYFEVNST